MDFLNLIELEDAARERLATNAYGYIRGGCEDEICLRENRSAFGRLQLVPRVLVDVSEPDLSIELLGRQLDMPVLLAPVAFQVLAHADGELASARAAAAAGTIFVASTLSSHPMDAIAHASNGGKWFQLYCSRDRGRTGAMLARAEDLGYEAVCMTVDVPVAALREADERNRFHLPPAALPGNLIADMAPDALRGKESGSALVRLVGDTFDPALTWRDVERLRASTKLPFLIKGILSAEDALLALEHGAQGVVVSNHGGRQLDCAPASIDVVAEIAAAVDGRAAVLLDGGVRRGSDVVKAMALGADAVLIGRPMVWGLAIGGEAGVTQVLSLLAAEIKRTLALLGRPSLADLEPSMVRGPRA